MGLICKLSLWDKSIGLRIGIGPDFSHDLLDGRFVCGCGRPQACLLQHGPALLCGVLIGVCQQSCVVHIFLLLLTRPFRRDRSFKSSFACTQDLGNKKSSVHPKHGTNAALQSVRGATQLKLLYPIKNPLMKHSGGKASLTH